MTRRKLVALVARACACWSSLGLLVVSARCCFVTRTDTAGRELRAVGCQPLVARSDQAATLYIGHLSGSFLTGVTIDSIAIRDKRGELFASTGPITLEYNPRDLVDRRVYRHARATIEHPYVHSSSTRRTLELQGDLRVGNPTPRRSRRTEPRGFGRLHRHRFGDGAQRDVLPHDAVASGRLAAAARSATA